MKALIRMAEAHDFDPRVLHAVEARNERQKYRLFERIVQRFGHDLSGRSFGLWGLAFKPGTDDMREAPSKVLLQGLIEAGARVRAYDPVAMEVAGRELPREWLAAGRLILTGHQYDALQDVDAMVLVTEWKPFRHPDFKAMRRLMRSPIVFDGRNQYDPRQMALEGFEWGWDVRYRGDRQ